MDADDADRKLLRPVQIPFTELDRPERPAEDMRSGANSSTVSHTDKLALELNVSNSTSDL